MRCELVVALRSKVIVLVQLYTEPFQTHEKSWHVFTFSDRTCLKSTIVCVELFHALTRVELKPTLITERNIFKNPRRLSKFSSPIFSLESITKPTSTTSQLVEKSEIKAKILQIVKDKYVENFLIRMHATCYRLGKRVLEQLSSTKKWARQSVCSWTAAKYL